MSGEVKARRARRIAVALDASEQSQRLMALAAGVAAALQAELEGVFVEDAVLLRLAGLPFLREFRLTTRREAAIDGERLQRELRASARRTRESVEQSARSLGCAWSFRVWRGDLEAEILDAALDAEMFTLAPLGRFAPLVRRPGPSRRERPGEALTVGVLLDGSDGADKALAAAAELAGHRGGTLALVLQGADAAALEALRRKALRLLGEEAGRRARLLPLERADDKSLAALGPRLGCDLLLVHSGNPLLGRGGLWASLGALGCPVLILR
jgi:hypothetical protein